MTSVQMNSQMIGLPKELYTLMMRSLVCEYASVKKDGTPVTIPLNPTAGRDGQTIDINTGLTYPWKAERARNNPKVCLLYSELDGMAGKQPAVVLVYGQAAVYDSDLQGNTDRYVRILLANSSTFRKLPRFILRWMVGYIARIWIAITPLKILWWPNGDLKRTARQWRVPSDIPMPKSDPPPRPLHVKYTPLNSTPKDWRRDINYALRKLGSPILTVLDENGYPVPFRTAGGQFRKEGALLNLHPCMPAKPAGRACLTFHNIQIQSGEMVANENLSFIGNVSKSGSNVLFEVERELPSASFKRAPRDMISLGKMMYQMRKRLQAEAERRGQAIPVVRFE